MLLSRFVAATLWGGMLVMGAVSAQDYPNKPIRIYTGTAGGPQDIGAREISQGITSSLGQPVVVDNRPGTAFTVPVVSKSPPDGYTLLVAGDAYWIMALLQGKPADPADLASISILTIEPNILVVHPSLPVKSVKELVALAKARPKQLNYSASLQGSVQHLSGLLFSIRSGVDMVPVNYKGSGAAVNGVTSGEVQLGFLNLSLVAPFSKSGRLRALAVTSLKPSALVPGLPTIAASGLPGYEMTSGLAIYAPPKTPAAIISLLNREVVRIFNRPDTKERFLNLGSDVIASSPEELTERIKSITATMGKLIKDTGIKLE